MTLYHWVLVLFDVFLNMGLHHLNKNTLKEN